MGTQFKGLTEALLMSNHNFMFYGKNNQNYLLIITKNTLLELMMFPSIKNQRTNGPVNAHLISWPSKAQNIQNLEKYMVKK